MHPLLGVLVDLILMKEEKIFLNLESRLEEPCRIPVSLYSMFSGRCCYVSSVQCCFLRFIGERKPGVVEVYDPHVSIHEIICLS